MPRSTVEILSPAALQRGIVASHLSRVDFADGYSGHVSRADLTAAQTAQAMFAEPPWFAVWLMAVRDRVMAPWGVQSSVQVGQPRAGRKHIDFFPVVSESPHTMVLGADDKHLDFRLYIALEAEGDGYRISASTLVKLHNRLGRVYLFSIMPFHRFLSRDAVRRAIARLNVPTPR